MRFRYSKIINKAVNIPDARHFFETEEAVSHYCQSKELLAKERKSFSYIRNNSKILDLGCGAGRTTLYFHEQGHNVIGVDLSNTLVSAAKALNREISYFVGDACILHFKDMSFDVVVFSFNGIDYIYPYQRRVMALREIKRVLKPGGLFIFSTHNNCIPRDWEGILRLFVTPFKKMNNTYITDSSYSWGGVRVYVTNPTSQIEELSSIGFEMIKLVPRNILKDVKSHSLIGLIDCWCYYVCRLPFK